MELNFVVFKIYLHSQEIIFLSGQLFGETKRQPHIKTIIMKNLYRSLIVLSLIFTGYVKSVNASHVAGVDFNYVCVGQDSFLITLNVFRDCSGIPAPTSPTVTFSSSCGSSFSQSLVLQNGSTGTEVSQLCAASISNSTCNGGSLPGMQQYIYTAIVVLAPPCNDWTMSWSECNRNSSVNLTGAP